MPKVLATACAALCCMTQGMAQLTINEACSKNVTVAADGEHFPDWVELHNAGSEAVDLAGHHLSDDPADPGKWTFPAMTIGAGAYLLLFEGNEADPGVHFDFKLAQEGETVLLSDPQLHPLSMLAMPWLRADHSYGRALQAGAAPVYFTVPTPGAPNLTTGYQGYAPAPVFDRSAGPYADALSVSISSAAGTEVRYSVDGREPDTGCPLYTGPVAITATGTLKAKAFADGSIPSSTTVATYLIGEHTDLPVVALSVHPDSLFHEELGLYMLGPDADEEYPYYGANFWDERGIAVHFEFFDTEGIRRVEQELELRIHGGRASRTKPQRPLRLTARDLLGDDRIRYPFFPERPQVSTFKRILLRNSGGDWCLAHYRDGFFHQLALHQGLDVDVLGFRPAVVFINGRYWGIHEIRERIDEDHLALVHGADRDSLLLMEEENLSIQGDTMPFHDLKDYIHGHDLNDPQQFAHVESLLDIPSFMDYFALEMFAGNPDWPSNNVKYWKPSAASGKWRYLLYDLDATMGAFGWVPDDIDMFHWVLVHRAGFIHAEIFRSLMTRHEFKRGFLNRLADLMNTALSVPALLGENDRIRDLIGTEVPRHYPRWGFPASDWEHHSGELIPAFIRARAGHMRADVLQWYDLPNTATLGFACHPPGAGSIHINTITPPLPFEGVYFNGNDIDITAEAAPGFRFDHWSYGTDAIERSTDVHLRRSFASDGPITAWFSPTDVPLLVFPDPFENHVTIVLREGSAGPTELLVHDLQGRTVHRSVHATGEGLSVDLSELPAGLFLVEARCGGQVALARIVKR